MNHPLIFGLTILLLVQPSGRAEEPASRTYENRLTPIKNPKPLLADHPEYCAPIEEALRFAAPPLIVDSAADLHVRGWRFSYNARGIIEIPNELSAVQTAVIVVHPWGVDDGGGWTTPSPAGVAFAGFPAKNQIPLEQMRTVVNPLLKRLRGQVRLIGYSLPGREDPIRGKVYRSVRRTPTADERRQGAIALREKLAGFPYSGQAVPAVMQLSAATPAVDYFRQFPGIDAGEQYNRTGFWTLPIPVSRGLDVDPHDVVFYDAEGYPLLRDFLKQQGVRHVLLCGFHTDMCVCSTTAGYKNLRQDFNVFLIGDATQATFPAATSPRHATTAALSYASLDLLITQTSWIRRLGSAKPARAKP